MKKIIGIFIMMLLLTTTVNVIGLIENNKHNDKINLSNPSPDDILDQEQPYDCGYGARITEDRWLAQSFKPTLEILTRIQLKMFRHGNPSRDIELTVSIRDSFDGNVLTTFSVDADQIISNDYWLEFDFNNIIIIPGYEYFIICQASGGDTDNCYCWYFGVGDAYTNGQGYSSRNSGRDWEIYITSHGNESDFSFRTYGRKQIPSKPETPTGPEVGDIGIEYIYYSKSTEPLDKQLYYLWDWGDDIISNWLGPYESGETVSNTHSWSEEGIYVVKVKAKNIDEIESEWSNPIIVGIPEINEGTDQKQDTCDGRSWGVYSGGAFAQSFIPSEKTLTSVNLYMKKRVILEVY
jgi:hypothetical protein